MAFSLSGTTVTQTGTDTSLAALADINGVDTFTAGNHTSYSCDYKFNFDGILTIDHTMEMLTTSSTAQNTVDINGTLILGNPTSSSFGNQGDVFGRGTALVIGKSGPGCCSNGPLTLRNGGRLEMYGATINFNGVFTWETGGEFIVRDGALWSHDDDGNTRIRCTGAAGGDIVGLSMRGIQFDWLTDDAFIRFEGLVGQNRGIPVENAVGSVGAIREWRSVPDPFPTADAFCNNWQGKKDVRLINCEVGSATLIVPDSGPPGPHGGRIFHEFNMNITDAASAPIENVKTYIIDTDNGLRTVKTTARTIDETADRTYEATSDVAGDTALQQVLTGMWYRNDDVGDLSAPNGNEVLDARGKTGVAGEDLFDINIASYPHLLSTASDIAMKGLEPRKVLWTLFDDPLVTEASKSAVDAYSTITDSYEFYDAAKALLVDSFAGETSTLVIRSGGLITTDLDVVVDPTAPQVIATTSTTVGPISGITINSTTFTGSITTPGTVTLLNGAEVLGTITDSTGTRANLPITLTNIITGSEVRIYDSNTGDEIDGVETLVGTTFSTNTSAASVDIVVASLGYINIFLQDVDASAPLVLPIQQQLDRQYLNP